MAALSRKDIRKVFSVMLQLVVLFGVGGCIALQFMDLGKAPVFERDQWIQRDGFTAISYQALTRDADEGVNTEAQFSAHLAALQQAGYSFITGQDVVDFYNNKPLPENALYLMLEGGRKDSAIFGQKVLSDSSGYAAFYTYTDTMLHRTGFFVDADQLHTLSRSKFWEVGSQGYKLIAFDPSPGMRQTFFLCDYERDGTGVRIESDDQMIARLEEFYRLSYEPVQQAATGEARAFIFPPANSFYIMPEGVELANRKLIEEHFDLAFTREGAAFNAAGQDVRDLTRMRIAPDMTAEELVRYLQNAHTERKGYALDGPESADEWLTYKSIVLCEGPDVIYIPDEKDFPVPAFLQGSHAWEDLDLSVVLPRENSERMIYLRYASKTSFVRVSVAGSRLLVQERLPGVGLRKLYDSLLPKGESCRLRLRLKGNRLLITMNDVPLPDGPLPLSRSHQPGRLGIAALADAGTRSVFGNLTASILPVLWQDRGVLPQGVEGKSSVTASIIPLPTGQGDREQALAALMQSAGAGEFAIAALPQGDMDFREDALLLTSLRPSRAKILWSGVLVRPGEASTWEDVERTLERIRKSGFSPVLRLSLTEAVALARSGQSLKADKFVLDFGFGDMPPDDWRGLAKRHNRNNFLYMSAAVDAPKGLYAPRRP
jgi:hypothetical protein